MGNSVRFSVGSCVGGGIEQDSRVSLCIKTIVDVVDLHARPLIHFRISALTCRHRLPFRFQHGFSARRSLRALFLSERCRAAVRSPSLSAATIPHTAILAANVIKQRTDCGQAWVSAGAFGPHELASSSVVLATAISSTARIRTVTHPNFPRSSDPAVSYANARRFCSSFSACTPSRGKQHARRTTSFAT